jgi:hypothetical protein
MTPASAGTGAALGGEKCEGIARYRRSMSRHRSGRKGERGRKEEEMVEARTRRGLRFLARVLVGIVLIAVIAIAGDNELRASVASWLRSPDCPWG